MDHSNFNMSATYASSSNMCLQFSNSNDDLSGKKNESVQGKKGLTRVEVVDPSEESISQGSRHKHDKPKLKTFATLVEWKKKKKRYADGQVIHVATEFHGWKNRIQLVENTGYVPTRHHMGLCAEYYHDVSFTFNLLRQTLYKTLSYCKLPADSCL